MKGKDRDGSSIAMPIVGIGYYWNDFQVGDQFRTLGRTITEADLVAFISTTGMVEEMFTNIDDIAADSRIGSRPVPGSMVYCFSEGLLMQSTMQRTGMAFLEADLRIHAPTTVGDTIHVECEIVEARGSASKPDRGLLRTHCKVYNQHGVLVATYNPLRMVKTRPEVATGEAK